MSNITCLYFLFQLQIGQSKPFRLVTLFFPGHTVLERSVMCISSIYEGKYTLKTKQSHCKTGPVNHPPSQTVPETNSKWTETKLYSMMKWHFVTDGLCNINQRLDLDAILCELPVDPANIYIYIYIIIIKTTRQYRIAKKQPKGWRRWKLTFDISTRFSTSIRTWVSQVIKNPGNVSSNILSTGLGTLGDESRWPIFIWYSALLGDLYDILGFACLQSKCYYRHRRAKILKGRFITNQYLVNS